MASIDLFEIRNRVDRNGASSGNKVRFKQLVMADVAYDLHTIQYGYDGLSRLLSADLYPGHNVNATPLREYAYSYDLAGNRLSDSVALNGGAPTVSSYSYNAANQITSDGTSSFTYDNNGNLIDDGVNEYTWDRANRLLEVDNGTPAELTAYAYDGVGNRISQAIGTASPVVTQYLLDTQPGLTKILAQTTDGNTDRFIHSQRAPQAGFPSVSILAHQDNSGDWFHPVQVGLGSVRGMADDVLVVQGMQHYAPYGSPFGVQGSLGMPFGFTGEQTDANELVYLRARYLNPGIGAFVSLDPFEGIVQRPMSLNGYVYVEGKVINATDPAGLQETASLPGFMKLGSGGGGPIISPQTAALIFEYTLLYGFSVAIEVAPRRSSNTMIPLSPPPDDLTTLFEAISNAFPDRQLDDATRKRIADLCNANFCAFGGIVWLLAQLGINVQTGVQTDTATDTDTDDDCTQEKVNKMTEGKTVAAVVYGSALSDRINGKRIKPAELKRIHRLGPGSVAEYAYWALCEGSPFPEVPLIRGTTFDTLRDGHHRFIASRLVNIPIASYYVQWEDSISELDWDDPDFDIGLEDISSSDFDDEGNYLAFEWSDLTW